MARDTNFDTLEHVPHSLEDLWSGKRPSQETLIEKLSTKLDLASSMLKMVQIDIKKGLDKRQTLHDIRQLLDSAKRLTEDIVYPIARRELYARRDRLEYMLTTLEKSTHLGPIRRFSG